jgi:hypothetical protein
MDIYDYMATYNTQDPEKLEELAEQELERWNNEQPAQLGAGPDLEHILNELIDLQDQIEAHKKLFLQPINDAYSNYKLYRDRCNKAKEMLQTFQDAGNHTSQWPHWELFNQVREARNEAYSKFEELGGHDARSEAWDKFNEYRKRTDRLVGPHRQVWAMYFNLKDEDITPYFTFGDDGMTDESEGIDSRWSTTDDIYGDTHIEAMSQEEMDFNESPYLSRDWWDEWTFNRKQNQILNLKSMEQASLGLAF